MSFEPPSGDIDELPSNDMIVGAFSFATYDAIPLRLERGDVLVAYSDGLTEAENKDGDMLGEDRVRSIIRSEASRGSKHLEEKLLETIHNFTMGRSQTDDITIMIVERV